MKKTLLSKIFLIVVLALSLVFTGCGAKSVEISDDETRIVVAASPTPHADILRECVSLMKEKGYDLVIKEFRDYVQPNIALENGDVQANYFQHITYLNEFNKSKGTHLVSVGAIHYEPFGIYAGKKTDLSIKTGLTIAVPNDPTNEARALLLLEQEGFITLKEGAGICATILDIVESNGNKINEIQAPSIASTRKDNDLVVLNGNYAIANGLKVSDALAMESSTGEASNAYGNVLAVHEVNKDKKIIKALIECLQSETIRKYINEKFMGSVVPKF